jgi:hypothetical protein
MPDSAGQSAEPTNAEILHAINHLADRLAAFEQAAVSRGMLRAGLVELARQNSQTSERAAERISRELGLFREDVLGLKTDLALTEQHSEDLQEAMRRHLGDPGAHRDAA